MQEAFFPLVEFRFLVVLAEQPFAALVSGPGNSGLPLAALDDGNFEMRTRNRHHPQTKRPPSKIALVNGLESYSVVLAALDWSAVRFGLRREPQKDSCKAAQGKCSFSLGWNRAGAQTPASISSSRLQDRNFTGTVYNCALYSKGFWTLLRS